MDGEKEEVILVTKIIVRYGAVRTGAEVSTSHTTPTQYVLRKIPELDII